MHGVTGMFQALRSLGTKVVTPISRAASTNAGKNSIFVATGVGANAFYLDRALSLAAERNGQQETQP